MKYLSSLTFLFLIISATTLANDIHKFGVGINYHLEQESAPGYQLNYQWQFAESFEFDTRYVESNDIEINQNSIDILGDYSQFSLGASFIKSYTESLSLKAGSGLSIITASSNESLVKKQSMTPYLSLAANYQISEHLAIEVGQSSHFNSEALGTHHSFYLSISGLFGETNQSIYPVTEVVKQPATKSAVIKEMIEPKRTVEQPLQEAMLETSAKETTTISTPVIPNSTWYVQFGAYGNELNARTFLSKVKRNVPTLDLTLLFHDQFYRVVGSRFDTKQRAEDFADLVKSSHGLSSYVINKKN